MVSLSALESIKEGERTPPAMRIMGKVSSGLGRAHIFMAQPHYQEQFRNILGSTAWPGTLNVNLENENLEKWRHISRKTTVLVQLLYFLGNGRSLRAWGLAESPRQYPRVP